MRISLTSLAGSFLMIPSLRIQDSLMPDHKAYLEALRSGGFEGDIRTDYGTRLTAATDNSVYQIIPQAVICPRQRADLVLIARLLDEVRFHSVSVCARGGGTGTDGSALNDGIIVDVSQHMKSIIEINADERWARIEPGVTLAQLNAAARPHGLFFAPNVAPADRATIGGMISTDAAGEGSRVYGKTSNHIQTITSIFRGGVEWTSSALSEQGFAICAGRDDLIGEIHREVDEIISRDQKLIERAVPKLWRFASGYNLGMVRRAGAAGGERFNLNWLLAGAEGTLGFIAEAKLRLTPLPRHFMMVVMKYGSFDAALGAAELIASFQPRAIETLDEKLLNLARTDESWLLVREFLDEPDVPMRAVNIVEFASDDLETVKAKAEALADHANQRTGAPDEATGAHIVVDAARREAMWNLRKRAVGLLGNMPGRRKPVPFVEDAAVPPERLRAFVRDMRHVLDRYQLDYGIFGHVDVGCLHVRPALDMTDSQDQALIRPITDEVAAIAKKYGGILWGEHGKGFRSEYNPLFFGSELYETMRAVKRIFDPRNQFNPGKIATAPVGDGSRDIPLATIDAATRGMYDRQIATRVRDTFDDALRCNGNGQCFSDDPHTVMCPSWKGTGDRIHSPKGRAAVFREWLRQLARRGYEAGNTNGGRGGRLRREQDPEDFSHEVFDAMQGCLACKACSGQCPVKVDVPDFRAAFLEAYHTRYRRPARDRMIGQLEATLPLLARLPRTANLIQRSKPVKAVMRSLGMVDAPQLAMPTLRKRLRSRNLPPFRMKEIGALDEAARRRVVLIVQDAFTSFYAPGIVASLVDLMRSLGYEPRLLPYGNPGKGLHVRGYLHKFKAVASRQYEKLSSAASLGVDLVGIDPAVTLMYRHEYLRALDRRDLGFRVELPQEWLARRLPETPPPQAAANGRIYHLLPHCTERALTPESLQQWRSVFEKFGLELKPLAAGCCGMGGAWGHEACHRDDSKRIFNLSWAKHLGDMRSPGDVPITTGYSCRSQTSRFAGQDLEHPTEVLCNALQI